MEGITRADLCGPKALIAGDLNAQGGLFQEIFRHASDGTRTVVNNGPNWIMQQGLVTEQPDIDLQHFRSDAHHPLLCAFGDPDIVGRTDGGGGGGGGRGGGGGGQQGPAFARAAFTRQADSEHPSKRQALPQRYTPPDDVVQGAKATSALEVLALSDSLVTLGDPLWLGFRLLSGHPPSSHTQAHTPT